MKTLEKQTAEYIQNEKSKNRNNYHAIGLTTDQIRFDNQKAFIDWFISKDHSFFITFVFNRKFDNPNVEQVVKYGKDKLDKFHRYIHKKIFGKYWYRADKINPQEHIEIVLLPQNILTNLHFHGIAVVKDSKMFPNKEKMFLENSNHIWKLNKELSGQTVWSYEKMTEYLRNKNIKPTKQQQMEIKKLIKRDVIVPNGSVVVENARSIYDTSFYSARQQNYFQHYENYYVNGSK